VNRLIFDEIDSTMDEARRRAAEGGAGPLWIMARRQTAGRGRRGRTWDSQAGNLMATLLVRPDRSPREAASLSLVAALAVADLFDTVLPGVCRLKWPNDPLLNGRKAAGILLESSARSPEVLDHLAIGVGANLAWHPDDASYPVTDLKTEAGVILAPEDALERLAAAWERRYAHWLAEGIEPVRQAWTARAHGIGGKVTVTLADERFDAIFEGLDASGACLARLPDGSIRAISSGEVFPAAA
jgi:BirA family biotin operon repressor/biotin-[acetyl-CoA-carboxylase] ligase